MNQIITITLPDGQVVEGHVTEVIKRNEFHLFTGNEVKSGERMVVRVESREDHDDRVARGCVD